MTQEEVIEKIQTLYDKYKTPAVVILRTPLAGSLVENGYGVDFDLPEYAVIFDDSKEDDRSILDRNHERYEMERQGFPDIFEFGLRCCQPSADALIKEMASPDEYKVIWRQETINPKE